VEGGTNFFQLLLVWCMCFWQFCKVVKQAQIQGGRTRVPPPLKLEKNMIFWRKIVIFHTKYPKKIRASLHLVSQFHIGVTTNTCKLRLFQGNSFLNIIYFYQKIKGKCCCITKTNKTYTSFNNKISLI
jgi:hypothetical protein